MIYTPCILFKEKKYFYLANAVKFEKAIHKKWSSTQQKRLGKNLAFLPRQCATVLTSRGTKLMLNKGELHNNIY